MSGQPPRDSLKTCPDPISQPSFSIACTATPPPPTPLSPAFTGRTIADQDDVGDELHIDITAAFNALRFPHYENEIRSPANSYTAISQPGASPANPNTAHAANHDVTRAISERKYSEGIRQPNRSWEHYWHWSPVSLILRAKEREEGRCGRDEGLVALTVTSLRPPTPPLP